MSRTSRTLDLALCAEVAGSCTASHLRRASRAVSNRFDAAMRSSGLRISQFNVLVALAIAGEVPVSQLADLVALDRTTMTRSLQPLERRGLVASDVGSDRRSKVLHITEKGRTALARTLPVWQRAQAKVVDDLGESRWKGLLQGLKAATSIVRSA